MTASRCADWATTSSTRRRICPFRRGCCPATKQKLRALRLTIPCLSSGCCLRDGATVETVAEVRAYIEAAESIGTPYVRVLGDLNPAPDGDVDDEAVLAALRALLPYAEEKGVTLLVETNGVYSDTARLRALLDRAPSDNVGALWDVHHPYRFAGESPEKTVQNLGMYIKHVHIKDSAVTADGSVEYRLMGEGDLPRRLTHALAALRSTTRASSRSRVKRWPCRAERRGRGDSAVHPLYVALYHSSAIGRPAAGQPRRHRQIRLAEGDAHRPDLPAGA